MYADKRKEQARVETVNAIVEYLKKLGYPEIAEYVKGEFLGKTQ